jgi:hypothetical protein
MSSLWRASADISSDWPPSTTKVAMDMDMPNAGATVGAD